MTEKAIIQSDVKKHILDLVHMARDRSQLLSLEGVFDPCATALAAAVLAAVLTAACGVVCVTLGRTSNHSNSSSFLGLLEFLDEASQIQHTI